jgi:hypothetical protein
VVNDLTSQCQHRIHTRADECHISRGQGGAGSPPRPGSVAGAGRSAGWR